MDRSSEQIQDYLRKELILKGYNTEEFQEFIRVKRPNDTDVGLWKLQDIQSIMKEFQSTHDRSEEVTDLLAANAVDVLASLAIHRSKQKDDNKKTDNSFEAKAIDFAKLNSNPKSDNLTTEEMLYKDPEDDKELIKAAQKSEDQMNDLLKRLQEHKKDSITLETDPSDPSKQGENQGENAASSENRSSSPAKLPELKPNTEEDLDFFKQKPVITIAK